MREAKQMQFLHKLSSNLQYSLQNQRKIIWCNSLLCGLIFRDLFG